MSNRAEIAPLESYRTLQDAVRPLQRVVRSRTSQRPTSLSYQGLRDEHNSDIWERFYQYLLTNHTASVAKARVSYSKKYYIVLMEADAEPVLRLSSDKRIHVMKALASLSKFLGCYDMWKLLREKYQLKWSNENSTEAFTEFFDTTKNLESMLGWLNTAISKLPESRGNILVFNTLTGLRPKEACESILLICRRQEAYLNPNANTLEHFRFPEIFIRRTKKAYISIISDNVLKVAKSSSNCGYNALRLAVKRNNLDMNMGFCRKIFATYLRNNGVEQEIVDILQGRTPKSVFAKYYFKPEMGNQWKVKDCIESLYKQLIKP